MKHLKKSFAYGAIEYSVIIPLIIILAIILFFIVKNKAKGFTLIKLAQDKVSEFIGDPGDIPSEPEEKLKVTFYKFETDGKKCMDIDYDLGTLKILDPNEYENPCPYPLEVIFRKTELIEGTNHFLFDVTSFMVDESPEFASLINFNNNKMTYSQSLIESFPFGETVQENLEIISNSLIYRKFAMLSKVEKDEIELIPGYMDGAGEYEPYDYDVRTNYEYLPPIDCEDETSELCRTPIRVSVQLIDEWDNNNKSKIYRFEIEIDGKLLVEPVVILPPEICPTSYKVSFSKEIDENNIQKLKIRSNETVLLGSDGQIYDSEERRGKDRYELFYTLNYTIKDLLLNSSILPADPKLEYLNGESGTKYFKISGIYYEEFEGELEQFKIDSKPVEKLFIQWPTVFASTSDFLYVSPSQGAAFKKVQDAVSLEFVTDIKDVKFGYNSDNDILLTNSGKVLAYHSYSNDLTDVSLGYSTSLNRTFLLDAKLYQLDGTVFKVWNEDFEAFDPVVPLTDIINSGGIKKIEEINKFLMVLSNNGELFMLNRNESKFDKVEIYADNVKDFNVDSGEAIILDKEGKLSQLLIKYAYLPVEDEAGFIFVKEDLHCEPVDSLVLIDSFDVGNDGDSSGIVVKIINEGNKYFRFVEITRRSDINKPN